MLSAKYNLFLKSPYECILALNGLKWTNFLGNAVLLRCYIRDVVFGCLKDIIRMNNNDADICISRPAEVLKVSFV